jgi:hypothetical protein
MKKKFRLQAISFDDRYLTIDRIEQCIDQFKGFLMNHKMYSDLQLSLYLEMKEYRLLNFYHHLNKVIRMSPFEMSNFDAHSNKTCRVYLIVFFAKGVGKLKTKIPRVPG